MNPPLSASPPSKLSDSEKLAIMDAYRMNEPLQLDNRLETGEAARQDLATVNYKAVMGQTGMQNFGSAAAGTMAGIGTGVFVTDDQATPCEEEALSKRP